MFKSSQVTSFGCEEPCFEFLKNAKEGNFQYTYKNRKLNEGL